MTDAPPVVKRTARAILLDTGPVGRGGVPPVPEMIVIKRTKPGTAPYWITPGGGVEPGDATVLDALHREMLEELGAKVTDVVPAFVDTVPVGPADGHHAPRTDGPRPVKVQHFFVCRPTSIDPSLRHGPEVEEPCGEYETVRLPFTRAGLSSVNLVPESLYRYLVRNIPGVLSLLAPDLR
ncbi:NUDIX domain-containing protein [Streptomyces calidiresistens]|uniref:NUDIX domain-containing protein n=1 Tax=Streptomyces calidiresistens TaxID=1485586 RepID=A0A7W3XXM5_9ACTN|nr:NUDIX hydrolase [Streptomyces calidiresistens]MBB0231068.1 NUDIX domain-containing protein [Streptomyces calidiresistens]